jgi:hypothetical protein
MQTLGLSESTPRTESRWRALFWPTIRNEGDFDYITRQGFWVCAIVAAVTVVVGAFTNSFFGSLFDGAFFFLAGLGVRKRSRVAAISAFTVYLLSGFVLQRYAGNGFGIARIIFLALLFANIRGNWLSARWKKELDVAILPVSTNRSLGDRLADQLPTFLWPKTRFVFYVLAAVELAALSYSLFAPRV